MPHYDNWENNDYQNLKALTESSFFRNCLLPDIRAGIVFPAFRNTKVDFYCLGQKLCSFNLQHEFRSNIAYLAAFQNRPENEINEADFARLLVCQSFEEGYGQIKANIALYKRPEACQTFNLCERFSVAHEENSAIRIVVLDAEIQRRYENSDHRIDLLLYDRENRELRFIEVKTFANPEIWPRGNDEPLVANQVERYSRFVCHQRQELLNDYSQYMRLIRHLVGLNAQDLPEPSSLDCGVDLLIVGFRSQERTILNEQIIDPLKRIFRVHAIGNTSRASQQGLIRWWGRRPG